MLGCLVFTVVFGPSGSLFVYYLQSFNPQDAWRQTLSTVGFVVEPVGQPIPASEGVLELVTSGLALFVVMCLIRYGRLTLLGAEPRLSSIAAAGESAYHRAFGLVSNSAGPLALMVVLLVLYYPSQDLIGAPPLLVLGKTILLLVINLTYATAIWVYATGLVGLYRFGIEPLNLASFHEDRMLGLHPLGRIATTFASAFSAGIVLILAGSLIEGQTLEIAIVLSVLGFGMAMLFLPLEGIHRKMQEVKAREEAALRMRSKDLLMEARKPHEGGPEVNSEIEELVELQRIQLLEARVSSISEWPFDTHYVERLVAIILAVFTVVFARLLQLIH